MQLHRIFCNLKSALLTHQPTHLCTRPEVKRFFTNQNCKKLLRFSSFTFFGVLILDFLVSFVFFRWLFTVIFVFLGFGLCSFALATNYRWGFVSRADFKHYQRRWQRPTTMDTDRFLFLREPPQSGWKRMLCGKGCPKKPQIRCFWRFCHPPPSPVCACWRWRVHPKRHAV